MGWVADELATARQRPDGHRNAERQPPGTHAGGAPRTPLDRRPCRPEAGTGPDESRRYRDNVSGQRPGGTDRRSRGTDRWRGVLTLARGTSYRRRALTSDARCGRFKAGSLMSGAGRGGRMTGYSRPVSNTAEDP